MFVTNMHSFKYAHTYAIRTVCMYVDTAQFMPCVLRLSLPIVQYHTAGVLWQRNCIVPIIKAEPLVPLAGDSSTLCNAGFQGLLRSAITKTGQLSGAAHLST